ncbi:alpha/beta-hydrolase [Myriangium duriaei CBS 260.36]|uniref:Alpha/beta-hydrolase n=1 Tax=Myriangium duriaei CBS 260.36 TaxID=1168546 RepID=A0A9P4IS28_9PEZI|nr:alpha/beta-hydrolase [Myriangium duriaei CBS 260.36]
MATPNPMKSGSMAAHPDPAPLTPTTLHIAGILTHVYGLDLLPPSSAVSSVAVLWLLHPRLQTAATMAPVAAAAINAWYARGGDRRTGLIAVAFDQRNHGTRLVDKLANEAWRQGNARHAVDMFSIYHGTSLDLSHILSHLPSYIFPAGTYTITTNLCLGVSLGGHAAWHSLLHDPRITAAVVVIGCPDYVRLMTDRAAKSKLPSWVSSDPPGRSFLGSVDFPRPLVEEVERWDPAGLLLGELDTVTGDEWRHEPSEGERKRLLPVMREKLAGKRVLCLSGGKDKLVPYACSEPFLTWLKRAVGKGGWFEEGGVRVEDVVDPGAGHEYSQMMREEAVRFICEVLSEEQGSGSREAKI